MALEPLSRAEDSQLRFSRGWIPGRAMRGISVAITETAFILSGFDAAISVDGLRGGLANKQTNST